MKQLILLSAIISTLLYIPYSADAQRHYKSLYPELQDSLYFETIMNLEQQQKYDSMVMMADEVFDTYYDKDNPDQAVFLFFSCVHRPSGSTLNKRVMPMIDKKLNKLRAETDTMNVHFANLLQLKGFGYKYQYRMDEAMKYYRQTEALFDMLEAPVLLKMGLYQSMGSSLINLKRYYEAYSYLKNTLPAFKSQNLLHDLAYSYLEIARAMSANNQIILAYEYNKKAHEVVSKNFPHSYNNVVISNNLTDNCIKIEKLDEALYYSHFADSVMKANNYTDDLYMVYFSILANRGIIHRNNGEYDKADKYFRELENQVIKYTGANSPILPDVYSEFVYNYLESGQADSAIFYIEKIQRMKPDDEKYYSEQAKAYSLKNEYDKAISALRKIQPNEQSAEYNFDNFNTQISLASFYREKYKKDNQSVFLDSILYYVASADRLISAHRNALLIGADDEALAEKYHNLAEIGLFATYELKKQNRETHEEKLRLISTATAFKLNTEAGNLRDFDLDVNLQLELRQKIRAIENQLLAMDEKADAELRNQKEQELFETRIDAFELSYRLQSGDKRKQNPTDFSKASYTDIQNQLGEKEALVAYFMGKDYLYSLSIRQNKTGFNRHKTGDNFPILLNRFYRKIKTSAADFDETSAELYDILIKPIEDELKNTEKISFIPDGTLNRIPFEALVKTGTNKSVYLIENQAVSYQYSIPLWLKSKQVQKKALSFTGFAPVFLSENTRKNEKMISYSETMRDAYAEMQYGEKLKPLPYSEKEVKAVKKLFDQKALPGRLFLHEAATEKNLKENAEQSSVIHIATHGISSYENPELSGLFFQKEANPEDITNDGFMYADEIYMLNLDADLVILSACKSAAGQIRPGEGVMALPRPFIFLDVPNLVASLWKIHDEKTKNMMVDFYSEVLNGQDYAQALRTAKVKSMARGNLPTDWAALILIGR